jgi:solute carrier family 25 (mitochondrial folate transporter), member 32
MIASSITYPHEVLRTRLHTQTAVKYSQADTRYIYDAPPAKPKYKGIISSVLVIFREEGIAGFYKGFTINLFRTVPASALTILTYELVRNAI